MLIYAVDLELPGKILLVVLAVTFVAGCFASKFAKSATVEIAVWMLPMASFGGLMAIYLFPSITISDMETARHWLEDCHVVEMNQRHEFSAPTKRLICPAGDEQVDVESYKVLVKAYRERGRELIAEANKVDNLHSNLMRRSIDEY